MLAATINQRGRSAVVPPRFSDSIRSGPSVSVTKRRCNCTFVAGLGAQRLMRVRMSSPRCICALRPVALASPVPTGKLIRSTAMVVVPTSTGRRGDAGRIRL